MRTNQWIPIEEGLPPNNLLILIAWTNEHGEKLCGQSAFLHEAYGQIYDAWTWKPNGCRITHYLIPENPEKRHEQIP